MRSTFKLPPSFASWIFENLSGIVVVAWFKTKKISKSDPVWRLSYVVHIPLVRPRKITTYGPGTLDRSRNIFTTLVVSWKVSRVPVLIDQYRAEWSPRARRTVGRVPRGSDRRARCTLRDRLRGMRLLEMNQRLGTGRNLSDTQRESTPQPTECSPSDQ